MFTVRQSALHGLLNHPFTQGAVVKEGSASPIGSNYGSVSCPRTLHNVDIWSHGLNHQPFFLSVGSPHYHTEAMLVKYSPLLGFFFLFRIRKVRKRIALLECKNSHQDLVIVRAFLVIFEKISWHYKIRNLEFQDFFFFFVKMWSFLITGIPKEVWS